MNETPKWWLLDEDGIPVNPGPRPDDASPENGEPCRPWYRVQPHLHTDGEGGPVSGIHFFGTLGIAQRILRMAREGLDVGLPRSPG